MRSGMDRTTGRLIEGWDHCVQSITIILTTRIGTLVLMRAFGSVTRDLQDRNPDPLTMMVAFVGIARALRLYEPGFRLRRIVPLQAGPDGVYSFDLVGDYFPRGHLGDYSLRESRTTGIGISGGLIIAGVS